MSKLILADEPIVAEEVLEATPPPLGRVENEYSPKPIAPASKDDPKDGVNTGKDQQQPVLQDLNSASRVANLLAMLDADRLEPATKLLRELVTEAVSSCLNLHEKTNVDELQIAEAVMRILEPILYVMRTPSSRESSNLLPMMAIPIGTTDRVITGLGLSPIIPGSLAALLIARAERQAGQIRSLLEIVGKLAQSMPD